MTGDNALARRVRTARREARLTQVQLARRLGNSQTFVSQAETGAARIGERYVQLVLGACQLSPDFGAPSPAEEAERELGPADYAGLDPETGALVVRGSERDKELKQKYFWWVG